MLITRPEPEAVATADLVAALGFRPVLSPSLRIETRPLLLPRAGRWQAILLTSGNAVAALPAWLHGTPLLAVGDATAGRARAAGFWRVSSAGRDAAALAALVPLCCVPDGAALLLATGVGQGLWLTRTLRQRRFRVLRRVAYVSRPERGLRPEARRALAERRIAAALFFSPASAAAFVRALRRPALVEAVRAVAISAATAEALRPLPWADIRVASRPNQDELLRCLT